jgi:hypothetical protein
MTYFAIMNVVTEQLYRKPGHYTEFVYESERGAKIACTKLNKSQKGNSQWVVIDYFEYCDRPVKMVERTNLMSGQKYMEAEDTPLCCSPASETYWSM